MKIQSAQRKKSSLPTQANKILNMMGCLEWILIEEPGKKGILDEGNI